MSDKFYLDCPCCGEDVHERDEPLWGEDESEKCSDCGCIVSVRVDEDDTVWTVASEDCER